MDKKVWRISGWISTTFYGEEPDEEMMSAILDEHAKNADENELFCGNNAVEKKEIKAENDASYDEKITPAYCFDHLGDIKFTDFTMEDYFNGIQKTNKVVEKMKKLGWDFDDIDQFSEDLSVALDLNGIRF